MPCKDSSQLLQEHFPSVIDRLEELKKIGINEVYISPIVLLQNKDYMKIFHSTVKYKNIYDVLKYGESLLSVPEDYNNMVSIIESICSGTPVITTSVPYNSSYVEKYKLGIVNDNWGVPDLERIVNQNYEYKRNCFLFRENLSAKKSASKLIEIYKNEL